MEVINRFRSYHREGIEPLDGSLVIDIKPDISSAEYSALTHHNGIKTRGEEPR
jgi:hypothetical protein